MRVYFASLANTQPKGLVELERRCQDLMQEVTLLSERQEVQAGFVEDKIGIQSEATDKYYESTFEEMRELEEKKSKEALVLVQKKHILMRFQIERDKARMLIGRVQSDMRHRSDAQDTFSCESCSSSMGCDMEEVSSESSKKVKDKDETHLPAL